MADISSSSSPSSSSTTPLASTSSSHHNEPALVDDLIAGWLGGAIGILASNPFEVLVRARPSLALAYPCLPLATGWLSRATVTSPSCSESPHADGRASRRAPRYPEHTARRSGEPAPVQHPRGPHPPLEDRRGPLPRGRSCCTHPGRRSATLSPSRALTCT